MGRSAVLNTERNEVVNIIICDDLYSISNGHVIIEDDIECGIGYLYQEGKFVSPYEEVSLPQYNNTLTSESITDEMLEELMKKLEML